MSGPDQQEVEDLRQLKHMVDGFPEVVERQLQNLLSTLDATDTNDERKYQLAMVDSFLDSAQGVRVPTLVNDSTITASDYQSCQVTIGATGRAMILINPAAVAASPYVVFNNLTTPFTAAATKIDTQVDPSGNILQNYAELAYPFNIT